MESMRSMFSTKRPQVFPQRISFCIEDLRGFSTKFSPLVFPLEYVEKTIYTKYLTQPTLVNGSGISEKISPNLVNGSGISEKISPNLVNGSGILEKISPILLNG